MPKVRHLSETVCYSQFGLQILDRWGLILGHLRYAALAAVAAVGFASVASAADMPVKAPTYKAPVVAVPPSWTGWYVGLNAGYGFGSESNTVNFVPLISPPRNFDNVSYSDQLNGFAGGGQIGYNFQITPNSWVAGVEADLQYTNFKGSASNSGIDPFALSSPAWTYNQDQKVNWLATVRGRLGWTPGDHTFLLYATGGLAVGGVKASNSLPYASVIPLIWAGNASATKTGWTLGGGVEARLTGNWTAKLEYLYYDLGHLTVIGTPSPAYTYSSTTDFAFHGNIVRAGLNYKFTSN